MKKERIFWGLFFILAAVLVILDRFSFFADISIIRLLITIALALWLFRSIIRRSMTGILFSIALPRAAALRGSAVPRAEHHHNR